MFWDITTCRFVFIRTLVSGVLAASIFVVVKQVALFYCPEDGATIIRRKYGYQPTRHHIPEDGQFFWTPLWGNHIS